MISPLFEVWFRTTHDDPIIDLSRKFASFKLYTCCNRNSDILEIVVDNPKEYLPAMEQLGPPPKSTFKKFSPESRVHIIKKKCSCLNDPRSNLSVIKQIENLALLYISPALTQKGWTYHRIIAFKNEDIKKLTDRLEKAGATVEIVRKVAMSESVGDLMLLHAGTLFSGITEKQMDALLTAYRHGYYNLPRKASIKAIAKEKHIPKTTYHEHLKKAENKLVAGLMPYMQLYSHPIQPKRNKLANSTR